MSGMTIGIFAAGPGGQGRQGTMSRADGQSFGRPVKRDDTTRYREQDR
jgi:hypothetical protein